MTEDIAVRRRRAQYRAEHRGTKEMDWMIGGYAARYLPAMTDPELADFERLLTVPDPELQAWLLAPEFCAKPRWRALVDKIRDHSGLAGNEPKPGDTAAPN